jgi:hypothetical protein
VTSRLLGVLASIALSLPVSGRAELVAFESVVLIGDTEGRFGGGLINAGDLNGDGYDDLVAADPGLTNLAGQLEAGQVGVHLGGPQGPSASPAWVAQGGNTQADFGTSISIGDLNGDGRPDLAVGARGAPIHQTQAAGRVYVYYGLPSAPWFEDVVGEEVFDPIDARAECGNRVSLDGDVNGDGLADLIFSCPEAGSTSSTVGDEGRVHAFYGSASGLGSSPDWSQTADTWEDEFGAGLAVLPDINGDGCDELLIGAEDDNAGAGVDAGSVELYLGSIWGLESAYEMRWEGSAESSRLGTHVTPAGDVNGDGYEDLLIASGTHTEDFTEEGKAGLYLGGVRGFHPTPAREWLGGQNFAQVSYKVTAAGAGNAGLHGADLDGDGYSDPVIGIQGYSGLAAAGGRVLVFRGGPRGGLDLEPFLVLDGSSPGGRAGWTLESLDSNGDEWPDLAAGAPSTGPEVAGVVRVFAGPLSHAGPAQSVDLGGQDSVSHNAGAGGRAVAFRVAAPRLLRDVAVDLVSFGFGDVVLTLYARRADGCQAGGGRQLACQPLGRTVVDRRGRRRRHPPGHRGLRHRRHLGRGRAVVRSGGAVLATVRPDPRLGRGVLERCGARLDHRRRGLSGRSAPHPHEHGRRHRRGR